MLTTCRNKHFKWWEALAVTAPEYKSFSEHFYPNQYLFHPSLQCQGSIVSSTWFVAISWAFWGQLVIIFSVFSFCHRQNVAFMSNWSWVIPKVTTLCKKKKKKKKSAQASTCSLQVLVCSTAMMRHAAPCARLQGVTHVRKEPLSPRVPFPSWEPWALCLQGWQAGTLHIEPVWKNVNDFDKR